MFYHLQLCRISRSHYHASFCAKGEVNFLLNTLFPSFVLLVLSCHVYVGLCRKTANWMNLSEKKESPKEACLHVENCSLGFIETV